ncbi:MAG: PEP-CTERM sorting domain-containing protein [Planctomycetota bacterium]
MSRNLVGHSALAVAAAVAVDAAGQTATPLVSEGDQPISSLIDADTGNPAAVDNIFGFAISPSGEYAVNLSYIFNQSVEIAPGVNIPQPVSRNIYFGDTGSGPQLLLEDDVPVGSVTRTSLGTPRVNAAGDLAYTSFSNTNPSNIGTFSEAALINDTVLATIGGAAPAGVGFGSGATIVSGGATFVELLEDGDAYVRLQATGPSGQTVPGNGPNAGEVGVGVDQVIAHYDAGTGTFSRVVGTGDTVTNPNGPDFAIGFSEIELPGTDADIASIGQVRVNESRTTIVYKFDTNSDENIFSDPAATNEALVYNDTVATFVDGGNVQEDELTPTRFGGDGVSTIASLGNLGVSNGGFWAANADLGTIPADDVILVNGGVSVSEGDSVPISSGLGGGTFALGGIFNGLTMNGDGDLAYVNNNAIILNGEVVVLEGVTALDGGGTLIDLFQSFELSDRDASGNVVIIFNADDNASGNGVETLYQITITPQTLIEGDFDYDRDLSNPFGDVDDIDILANFFDANGFNADGFDLTDDGIVDFDDTTYLVETLFGTLLGDANLDGVVDELDLALLDDNFHSDVTSWAFADFTGNDFVDIDDVNLFVTNYTGDQQILDDFLARVPEPGVASLLAIALGLGLTRRRSPQQGRQRNH